MSMVPHSLNRSSPESPGKLLILSALLVILLSGEARGIEQDLVILRSRWMKAPRERQWAEPFARQLFLEGRREEACRILISVHAHSKSSLDRGQLESLVRVISRSFLSTDSSKAYQSGLNALMLGRVSVLEERMGQVLVLEPAHFDALVRRGQGRWLLGNDDGAFEDFSQALGINPFEPEAQAWLAVSLFRRGEKGAGFIHANEAMRSLTADQKRRPIWRALQGVLLWESSRQGVAREKLMQLARERRGPPWVWDYLLRQDPSDAGVIALARALIRSRPAQAVDLDDPSGIGLEWWDPEAIRARLPGPDAAHGGAEWKKPSAP